MIFPRIFLIQAIAVMLLLFTSTRGWGVTMRCASVNTNGSVTFSWDNAGTSSVNFHSWYVYHSTSASGPFTAIDSTFSFFPTSFTDNSANAANNNAYYFVSFESNNGTAPVFSDTIRSIGINVNNPGNGYADITWNAVRYPLTATNSPFYIIYREYPAGIFTKIDSVDARTAPVPMIYHDTISVCDDTIKYRIEVSDAFGCKSVSFVKGDRFHDLQVPLIPEIDSVSVDALGNAVIGWPASQSKDTRAYVILSNNVPVDTVIGYNNTFYGSAISASTAPVSFTVIAVDSCNNPSSSSPQHSSIYANAGFDLCERAVHLNWTAYDTWPATPVYEVYVSVNGSAETFLGSTSLLSFTDTSLVSGNLFCYRVRAVDLATSRTSTSNRACITPNFPAPPLFSYIRKVSYISTDEVLIVGYVDPGAALKGYVLKRASSASGPFSTVASIDISGVTTISFTDRVPYNTSEFYYFIVSVDSCGRELLESQISNTIVATAIANDDFTNTVNHTDYREWPAGVSHYNIYRWVNGLLSNVPIVTITDSSNVYVDTILNNFFADGNFCYVVEAIEAPGNSFGFRDSSRSNEICVQQHPLIFIPNAFHPGGFFNEFFYPSNVFVPMENYTLDIFNRWGELIFHSVNPKEGWDGVTNGRSAPEGVYIYRIRAGKEGEDGFEKVGSVTLIR